jgi:hypothetical protein
MVADLLHVVQLQQALRRVDVQLSAGELLKHFTGVQIDHTLEK